ncbi:MAG: hypothetical protein IJI53_02190 [Clostridia bacterium]|nr:hypothetical protein [Clostridia bacterium]
MKTTGLSGGFIRSTKFQDASKGRSPSIFYPQPATCAAARSNRMLLPLSISGRKKSVFACENAFLQEIDVPKERTFFGLSFAGCRKFFRRPETTGLAGGF